MSNSDQLLLMVRAIMILGQKHQHLFGLENLDDEILVPGAISSSQEAWNAQLLGTNSFWEQTGVLGPIYRLLAKGLNDNDIAERLNLSEEKVQACIAKDGWGVCDRSKLTPAETEEVTTARRQLNASDCENGAAVCDHNQLTASQTRRTTAADLQRAKLCEWLGSVRPLQTHSAASETDGRLRTSAQPLGL